MHVARGVPCAKVFSAKSSFTPIRESFLPRKIPAIRYLITIQDGMTAVTMAARGCHTHTMDVLVRAGASHDPQVLRVS